MPSQAEETVVQPDAVDAKHILEHVCDPLLQISCRCHVNAVCADGSLASGLRESFPVDLQIWSQWELIQHDEMSRDHEFRQRLADVRAKLVIRNRLIFEFQISDDAGVARSILADDDHCLADVREQGDTVFDFTKFDTITADFDLVVRATNEMDLAIGANAHQVAGSVHPASGHKGVGQEPFGCQIRTIVVPAGHPITANEKLAGQALRHWPELLVQHIKLRVGDRRAKRHVSVRIVGWPGRRPDRRFCRAVHIFDAGIGNLP